MQNVHERLQSDRLGQDDSEVRAAIRFVVLATIAGVGFVIMAALWVSTCPGAGVDTVACGAPQRTMLALAGPLILLGAGLWAFLRTYWVWRYLGTWWGWQGAGWFLLTSMVLTLSMSAPPILGPALPL